MTRTATKAEFARLVGVSRQRVSQYLAAGKLHGEAIVGEGAAARIVVSPALVQLGRSLDLAQGAVNGARTRLSSAPRPPVDDDDPRAEYQLERLAEIRRRNRRAEIEEAREAGLYARTADVRAGYDRLAGEMLQIFDGALAAVASEVSAAFGLPNRDVLHAARRAWLAARKTAADAAARDAAGMPATIEDKSIGAADDTPEAST